MKKTLLYSVLSLSLIFPTISNAQCGFDVIRNKQLQNPAFEMQEQANELKIKNFVNNVSLTGKAGTVYTIPVVVHVLHKGEAVGSGTNISDAQIQSGIDRLNEVYRGLDPNSPIDFEIEFTLAQRDPNCNATTGINRVNATSVPNYSANGVFLQSVGADENTLKDLSRWPETDYLNIWIVTEIDNNNGGSGIQGYANFFNGNAYEGSVMMYTVFGYDPTNANPSWPLSFSRDNSTPIHEFGHYFHLYHTFQGDNDDVDCPGDAVVGTDSDGCADTEIHKRHTSTCPTNNDCLGNNPYGLNTRNNYMSYFSCTDRLTANQKTRVTAAMTGTSIVGSKGSVAPDPSYSAPVAVCTITSPLTNNSGILNVELNGLNMSSGSSSSDGGSIDKSDNCSNYFEIDASVSNTINVDVFSVNFQQLGIWIDWNDDGDFNDNAEQQHLSQDIAAASTVPVVLTYPTIIPYDDYIRVRLITDLDDRYGAPIIANSCSTPQYGQSEDYAIYVKPSAGCTPPAITSHPVNRTICVNTNTTFVVAATDAVSYQWQVNTGSGFSNISNGGVYSGATLATLTITGSTIGMNGYTYRCVVTGACAPTATTNSASLTVNATNTASAGSSTPTLCINTILTNITHTTTGATGIGAASGLPSGVTANWNANTITISGTPTSSGTFNYSIPLSGGCGTVNATGTIVVNPLPGNAGAITGSISECDNATSVAYSISSVSGATGYNWTVPSGATVASGQNSTSITVDFGVTSGNVSVTPTNSCGNGGQANKAVTIAPCGSAPVANFSTNTTTICAGESVNFTDLSTNTPTSWSWDFGDGGSSSSQNTTYTYNTAGTYSVTLTATNASGSDDEVKTNLITVKANPIVFTSSTDETCTHNDGTATASGGGTYLWDDALSQVTSTATGLVAGTYNVIVTTNGCSAQESVVVNYNCGVIVPATKLHIYSCGITLTDITRPVYANAVQNATSYTFNITNTSLGFSYDKITSVNYIRMNGIPGIQQNTSYSIKVKATVGGVQGVYGDSCQVTTPISFVPLTQIQPKQCGILVSTSTTPIYANPIVDATGYYFEVTNIGLGYSQTKGNWVRYFRLSQFTGLQPNTVYTVRVKAIVGGNIGEYGNSCTITTPSSLMVVDDAIAKLIPDNEMDETIIEQPTILSIYPNPNSGEQLNVNLENLIPNSILTITDIYGKVILTKLLNTDQSEYKVNVKFDNKLVSGFYFINIVSDGNRITEKLIVR